MILRKQLEEREHAILSQYAAKSDETKGRSFLEAKDDIRTEYQRDRDRIIHSKSLRRLMHKTQVFLSPEGDHFRTRLTHTLEVSQIARTISRALCLNEDLTEAIAMGHDLGHTPFGHNGEEFLNEIHEGGFKHNEQSLRVVDVLEKNSDGRTMNLTEEVRDGIVNHSGKNIPSTLEGQIVRFSDRIAYINHDIDDALRAHVIKFEDLPEDCIDFLGKTHGERINTLVLDIINNSDGKKMIMQGEEAAHYMGKLREFMFDNIYRSPIVKKNAELEKIKILIYSLYDYFLEHPNKLPSEYKAMMGFEETSVLVKDFVAGMTDRYAINLYQKLFVPQGWKIEK